MLNQQPRNLNVFAEGNELCECSGAYLLQAQECPAGNRRYPPTTKVFAFFSSSLEQGTNQHNHRRETGY